MAGIWPAAVVLGGVVVVGSAVVVEAVMVVVVVDTETLAPMHAPAYTGDCRTALMDLAADFDRRIAVA